MARSDIKTLLSLDRWAEIIGLDPRHFNQITTNVKPVHTCDKVWKQHAWQENDQVSRDDVALAIQQAEEAISHYLGYKLLPTWQVDEKVQCSPVGSVGLFNRYSLNVMGFPQSVQTKWGHFISGGIEAKSLIAAGTAVVLSDADGDTYKETATITFATLVTDPDEIAVYFAGYSGAEEWQVKPLRNVTIAAGVCIVTLWKHQIPTPAAWEVLDPTDIDGDDDSLFEATLDVYRHYNDPQQQVQLNWSPRPGTCDCGSSTCYQCSNAYQWGCLNAKDNRAGQVHYRPGTWNAATKQFDSAELAVCRAPDKLRLWYYAGHRDERKAHPQWQMDSTLERAVVFYSVTLLDRPICGCNNLEKVVQKWNEELNLNMAGASGANSYQISDKWLDNPLGVTRGAMFAWTTINEPGRLIGHAVRY